MGKGWEREAAVDIHCVAVAVEAARLKRCAGVGGQAVEEVLEVVRVIYPVVAQLNAVLLAVPVPAVAVGKRVVDILDVAVVEREVIRHEDDLANCHAVVDERDVPADCPRCEEVDADTVVQLYVHRIIVAAHVEVLVGADGRHGVAVVELRAVDVCRRALDNVYEGMAVDDGAAGEVGRAVVLKGIVEGRAVAVDGAA